MTRTPLPRQETPRTVTIEPTPATGPVADIIRGLPNGAGHGEDLQ